MDIYTATSCMKISDTKNVTAMCIINNIDDNSLYFEIFPDDIQTNQKAELYCIKRILEIYNNRDINIYSRSQYAVNCINIWSTKWKQNNWNINNNKSIENIAIVKEIIDTVFTLNTNNITIVIKFISKNDYNEHNYNIHNVVSSKLKIYIKDI